MLIMLVFTGVLGGICWHHHSRSKQTQSRESNRAIAQKYCTQYQLPIAFVSDIISAESSWNQYAESKVHAKGLMQIMPAAEKDVAKKYGIAKGDPFDPEYNLHVGIAYLRMLADRKSLGASAYLVVGAYHMGPTRLAKLHIKHAKLSPRQLIEKHAGPATRAYCKKILNGKDWKIPPAK